MKRFGPMVMLLALALTSACNKDDYFGTSMEIEGLDAACGGGTDVSSCEAIQGCQAAFEDVESVEPVFASCIANPPAEVIVEPPVAEVVVPAPGPKPPVIEEVPEVEVEVVEEVPTIDEAFRAKCENLDEKYLLIKKYSDKGQSRRVKKVKICHQTKSSEHAIIVACPALKAHVRHSDYLGACKIE